MSDPISPQQLSSYTIPQNEVSALCTAHNFDTVPLTDGGRVLVSAWYNGAIFTDNFDESYVPSVPNSRGFDVFTVDDERPRANALTLDHLNPQTQEELVGMPAPNNAGVDALERGLARERSAVEGAGRGPGAGDPPLLPPPALAGRSLVV